jgi:peptidoglycan hydrolase CwlO-like protein/surface antigen
VLLQKQKMKKSTKISQTRSLLGIITICVVLILATLINTVRADQFDDQIRALQNQNNTNQAASNQLGAQASSYADAINKLQEQISALQAAIAANQQHSDDIKQQIIQAEAELDQQKKVLGENIRAMYLEGKTSTLEMLASSRNLSDFVDKQQSRNAVQSKVKDTMAKITALQEQLKNQQQQLQSLIKDQQAQNAQLTSAQAQQSQLLAFTEGQKSAYDQQIQSNNSQISTLRAQQAAANARLGGRALAGDPGHGGYPAYLDSPVPEDSKVDPWGMYNRECVSYTAWKVYQTFGHMPNWGGTGNANQWPADARSWGVPTGTVPRAHSVAISMGGAYGHAMWVEAVSGNTIYVSQYNYDLAGHYSEMSINGSGLIYLYFQ